MPTAATLASSSAALRTAAKGVTGTPAPARNCFSAQPLLRRVQDPSAWTYGHAFLLGYLGYFGRHILKFKGDDGHLAHKIAHGIKVGVGCTHLTVGNLAGRRVTIGRERVDPVAHGACRQRKHSPKLPAAKDADSRTGENGFVGWPGHCVHDACLNMARLPAAERAPGAEMQLVVPLLLKHFLQYLGGTLLPELIQGRTQVRLCCTQDRNCQQSSVGGPGATDGHRRYRYAGGHLHD